MILLPSLQASMCFCMYSAYPSVTEGELGGHSKASLSTSAVIPPPPHLVFSPIKSEFLGVCPHMQLGLKTVLLECKLHWSQNLFCFIHCCILTACNNT